jgi:transcription-repair coupling factor (superfamily II helicase)
MGATRTAPDRRAPFSGSAACACAPGNPVDLIGTIASSPVVRDLAAALDAGRRVAASGVSGSSTSLVSAALARLTGRPVVLVVAHMDDADEAADELDSFCVEAARLPAVESLPGESGVSLDLFAERLKVARRLLTSAPSVLVCPIQALMQGVPSPDRLDAVSRTIRAGQTVPPNDLARWLDSAGYARRDAIEEPGDFALRGGILDVFPPAAAGPVRLDYFGDVVDRITEVDLETMGSGAGLELVDLVSAAGDAIRSEDGVVNVLTLLPRGAVAVVADTLELTEQARGYFERVSDSRGLYGPPAVLTLLHTHAHAIVEVNQFTTGAVGSDVRIELPVSPLASFASEPREAIAELSAASKEARVAVFCQNAGELQRFQELLAQFAPEAAAGIESRVAYLHRGFAWDAGERLMLLPYHELVHRYHARRRAARLRAGRAMDTFLEFAPGDFVVHAEHGIARFVGLKVMKAAASGGVTAEPGGGAVPDSLLGGRVRGSGAESQQEYLTLEFAGRTRLHVPATHIDQVQKYVGGFKGKPPLSTLGGQRWRAQKERVSQSVRDLAGEMLRVRAAREHMPGIRYPGDTAWQREFEAEFPYEETEDQLAALAEIKKDMAADRPMDRLVCGDVGFGKTELAIRAAFKAAEYGKQTAVLVPTTVLAEQHERTFKSRFAGYPFRVESLSRFKTDAQQRAVLEDLRCGRVDVVIGTHRLLSEDVRFADLGLVIVDEEQRFGVEHKERLLRLRLTVDVLTLSATPIPRTLHMAMLGLRDISSLTTPPLDRRAIVTEVIPYNERRLSQVIARELAREGQVYFVHNRVHDIRSVADDVARLAPGARLVVGHGQMSPHELEDVMLRFIRRQADILVSTTIIESGIDIPTANTMIIDDADRFGLADLHQLRGRVGRYKHRAYCYLLLPADRPVSEVAQRRLKAIERYAMLGAGFKIAMRDLEIRGAGNLLGAEQSGHIAAVGYEMYCRLLDQAVHELTRGAPPPSASKTSIEVGVFGIIPRPYIPSDQRRLEAYRRIAVAATPEELSRAASELAQAYGSPPQPVQRLFDLAELRLAAAGLGVRSITIRGVDVLFRTENPSAVAERLAGYARAPLSAGSKGRVGLGSGAPGRESGTRSHPVRVLPPPSGESLHEVYFRPPPAYMEPDTLVAVLRKRLGPRPS